MSMLSPARLVLQAFRSRRNPEIINQSLPSPDPALFLRQRRPVIHCLLRIDLLTSNTVFNQMTGLRRKPPDSASQAIQIAQLAGFLGVGLKTQGLRRDGA